MFDMFRKMFMTSKFNKLGNNFDAFINKLQNKNVKSKYQNYEKLKYDLNTNIEKFKNNIKNTFKY